MSKDQFKEFVQKNPQLAKYVEDNTMTWQKFYELYELYGESKEVWSKYQNNPSRKVSDFINKVDPDSLQKHIESAQKALNIFSELANKTTENIDNNIKPNIERPLSKFFGD